MEYIRITRDNIDAEHVCCAMSGKQALAKKEWLKRRFDEGLIFYRSVERGKCFIEYIPAENAWVPIQADGYLYIDCLWVAGSMKGHGYSNDLLRECVRDAKEQGRRDCVFCLPKDASANPSPTRNTLRTRVSWLRTRHHAESCSCTCRSVRTRSLRNSKNAPNIPRRMVMDSFSITRTSVRSPTTGCHAWKRWRKSTAFH